MIQVCKLINPVHLGGDVGDITFWSRDKYGKVTDVADIGGGFVEFLSCGKTFRVPMSNVSYLIIDKSEVKPLKKGGQL